jgi:hypothetical protein
VLAVSGQLIKLVDAGQGVVARRRDDQRDRVGSSRDVPGGFLEQACRTVDERQRR